jgi:DNA-binding NarL/FixJ family response regulator
LSAASILIADDHAVVRRGLRALLGACPGWKVVAEASNGREAVKLAEKLRPDLAILDISMPGLNGLDATRLIKRVAPKTQVLVLTMYDTRELIEKTFQAGARGYVVKSDAEEDLVTALRALIQGKTFFSSPVSRVVLDRVARGGRRKFPLTVREAEIVQLLAEGRSNKEVAGTLGISVRTVENHRAKAMDRLGLANFSDLVRYAIRNRMIGA